MHDKNRQMAFYGKGGIGKSTVVSNLTSYFAMKGLSVLQVGCDPKHDSSRPFLSGRDATTIIDLLKNNEGYDPSPDEFVMEYSDGIKFIEVGGPEPGVGCAGRGILKMFEILEKTKLLDSHFNAVLYDVLGDVVCGGFAAPLRAGYAREIYIVISGEYMAIYAANNICRGILNYAKRRDVRLGGIILNARDVPYEFEVAEKFARGVNSSIAGVIPRNELVSKAEIKGKTVVELFPGSPQGEKYSELGEAILKNTRLTVPAPFSDKDLHELYYSTVYNDED